MSQQAPIPTMSCSPSSPTRSDDTQLLGRIAEVAGAFLRLGSLSFGGPIAHLAYFRAEFVEKRKWLDDAEYGDLVALCQFLPGPVSSQVVVALGKRRAGLLGALVASVCFTGPSALLMLGFACGVARASDQSGAGWLHGLKLAAVAVVAQAVWSMGKKLCTDRARRLLCIATAAGLLVVPGAISQLGAIAFGGFVGFWLYRDARGAQDMPAATPTVRGHSFAVAALVTFALLLVGLPWIAGATGSRELAVFNSFYRSGALVFGGGHVVLPLLRAELVPRGWLSDSQFLAGYGAAQALPGPLFAFSAYLGAAMSPGRWSLLHGLWCLLGIFLPAWLLILGALPFWERLRVTRWATAALAGANATVVGVLLAALYDPVFIQGVQGPRDLMVALLAFGLLEFGKATPWLVVAASAVAGYGFCLPR